MKKFLIENFIFCAVKPVYWHLTYTASMAFDIYPGSPYYIFDFPKTLDIYEQIQVNLCILSHLRKHGTKVTQGKGDTE